MMRAAATAGIFCPTLFVATLAALTALQHDFMLGISWRPLRDPAGAWPSGLALGLRRGMKDGSRIGHTLLLVAGVAMALMAFETDPIRRTGPRTWHGWIHDVAFVVFALALLGALFFLWRGFRRDPR